MNWCVMCGANADIETQTTVTPLTPAGVALIGDASTEGPAALCVVCLREHFAPLAALMAARREKVRGQA